MHVAIQLNLGCPNTSVPGLIQIPYSGNFRYQALKVYFRGIIFVVCPEHVIIVAYCPRLLFKCTDSWLIFHFGALRSKNKPFLLYTVEYSDNNADATLE